MERETSETSSSYHDDRLRPADCVCPGSCFFMGIQSKLRGVGIPAALPAGALFPDERIP